MGLPIPTVSGDPGPDWAQNVDACLTVIDGHNHSPGSGVQINPSGLNINSDLTFNSNNATALRSVRFTPQSAPLALPADLGTIYESGVDLYYNDGSGNQVRITQSGSVTGSAGTITGLPSGTASASYSGGTFTFQKATSTPAHMSFGGIVIGQEISGGFGVTVQTSASEASNYSLTLPTALPAATSYLQSDNAGNLSFGTVGYTPLGGVIATFPNLTGAYTTAATTVADANGFVLCQGQTVSDSTSPMNGAVIPNLNSAVFLQGNTTAGGTGGQNTLPAHTHGAGSFATSLGGTFAATSHSHNFAHTHAWGDGGLGSQLNTRFSSDTSSVTGGSSAFIAVSAFNNGTSSNIGVPQLLGGSNSFFTSGVVATFAGTGSGNTAQTGTENADSSLTGSNSVTGTSSSTGSGSSLVVPPFVNTVYIMRIK